MADAPLEGDILVALVDENRISRDLHEKILNAEPGVTVISAEAILSVTMLTEEQPDVVMVEAGASDVVSLHTVKPPVKNAMKKTRLRTRLRLAVSTG